LRQDISKKILSVFVSFTPSRNGPIIELMQGFRNAGLFCSTLLAGYFLVTHSWGGTVYVFVGEKRSPAAVRSISDYSEMDRSVFGLSVHDQLLKYAVVEEQSGTLALHFGNPLISLEDGSKAFACRIRGRDGLYEYVTMIFEGVGVTDNGESPNMILTSTCSAEGRVAHLDPILLPKTKLLAGPARDFSLELNDQNRSRVVFKNLHEWPPQWALSKVRFSAADSGATELVVEAADEALAGKKVLSFDWK
jgi:hypothetical protein